MHARLSVANQRAVKTENRIVACKAARAVIRRVITRGVRRITMTGGTMDARGGDRRTRKIEILVPAVRGGHVVVSFPGGSVYGHEVKCSRVVNQPTEQSPLCICVRRPRYMYNNNKRVAYSPVCRPTHGHSVGLRRRPPSQWRLRCAAQPNERAGAKRTTAWIERQRQP